MLLPNRPAPLAYARSGRDGAVERPRVRCRDEAHLEDGRMLDVDLVPADAGEVPDGHGLLRPQSHATDAGIDRRDRLGEAGITSGEPLRDPLLRRVGWDGEGRDGDRPAVDRIFRVAGDGIARDRVLPNVPAGTARPSPQPPSHRPALVGRVGLLGRDGRDREVRASGVTESSQMPGRRSPVPGRSLAGRRAAWSPTPAPTN